MVKGICLAALLFFLLLSSGCIRLSPEQRHNCLDLTERSYAYDPECDSHGQCFSSL
ncbi:MAG: hypothetical protein Q8N60_04710 [Candidatus Diapherotrites archaeon]|nr:hypothetical protein [Candidatus Diapherotrites archaeon]